MQRNILIAIITLFFLSVVFIIISLLVFISYGKVNSLIAKKLLIGGLILSLTTSFISCSGRVMCYSPIPQNDNDYVTCYKVAANYFAIENNTDENGKIILNLKETNIIKGQIDYATGNQYSFRITTENSEVKQLGDIVPSDGKFDNENEKFSIEVDKELSSGDYMLYFFNVEAGEQSNNLEFFSTVYQLSIFND